MIPTPMSRALVALSLTVAPLVAWTTGCSLSHDTNGVTSTDEVPGAGESASGGGSSLGAPSGSDASTGATGSGTGAGSQAAPPTATFLTLDTSQYLTDGDGGALVATGASTGAAQTFTLTDVNGGSLASGDTIYVASASGAYLSAADGGGGAVAFSASTPGADETFVLVLVDDAGAGTPIPAGSQVALQTQVTGNYVSAINGGGGQVLANAPWHRAWETYTLGLGGSAAPDAGAPSGDDAGSSPAADARQKVLAFLAKISGNHTAIGVEDKDSSNPEADSNTMASMAGDGLNPSFWSADWGFGSAAEPSEREGIVQEGEKQWGEGAIVQYIYHACPLSWGQNEQGCAYSGGTDPIDGSYGDLSDAQWTDLTTSGGTLNGVWLARLDTLATYFQELKTAGVAPLFRIFHEMNGQWAWWQGRPGPTGSAKLFQLTHDYLVNTKGLDNIIWVWNVQDYTTLASDVGVYTPGTSYFDLVSLDVYDTGYTSGNYQAMQTAAAGKPFGVGECEYLPGTDVLSQQPLWAYVAMWPDFFSDNTSQIPALFNDPTVITLSAMPGW